MILIHNNKHLERMWIQKISRERESQPKYILKQHSIYILAQVEKNGT
jgi:hypothetical protein